MRALQAIPVVIVVAAVGAATPTFAQSPLGQSPAKSYYCQLHPHSSRCTSSKPTKPTTPPKTVPSTGGGGMYGKSTGGSTTANSSGKGSTSVLSAGPVISVAGGSPPLQALPATGGASPSPATGSILSILAFLLIGFGAVTRRVFRR